MGDLLRWSQVIDGPPRVERRRTVSVNAGVVEYYTYEDRAPRRSRRPGASANTPARPFAWEFTRVVDPYEGRAVRSLWNRLGFHNDRWQYSRGAEHLVVCPLWPLLVLSAALPVGWDVCRRRRAARRRAVDSRTPPPAPEPHR